MAHKKGQGSSRNGRDSNPQHRGVKVYGGQLVKAGAVIVRQCGTRWKSGLHVGCGRDYTLYARIPGTVDFTISNRSVSIRPIQMEDDEDASIHEAAHAVILWKAGVPIRKATLVPNPVTGSRASVTVKWSRLPKQLDRDRYETLFVAFCAGSAGVWLNQQQQGVDQTFGLQGGDAGFLRDIARSWFGSEAEFEEYVSTISKRAIRVLNKGDNWRAAKALAGELRLYRTLPGCRVSAIIKRHTVHFPQPPSKSQNEGCE